jgi:hypothetical protein
LNAGYLEIVFTAAYLLTARKISQSAVTPSSCTIQCSKRGMMYITSCGAPIEFDLLVADANPEDKAIAREDLQGCGGFRGEESAILRYW